MKERHFDLQCVIHFASRVMTSRVAHFRTGVTKTRPAGLIWPAQHSDETRSFEVFSGIQLFCHFFVIIMFVCGGPRGISGKNTLSSHGTLNPSHNNLNVGNSFEKLEYWFEMSESRGEEESLSFNNVFC